jgi:hypoxanthine-guanine phosphoribosyltransferase
MQDGEYTQLRIKRYAEQIAELSEKIKLCKNHVVIEIYRGRIEFFEKLKKELEISLKIV